MAVLDRAGQCLPLLLLLCNLLGLLGVYLRQVLEQIHFVVDNDALAVSELGHVLEGWLALWKSPVFVVLLLRLLQLFFFCPLLLFPTHFVHDLLHGLLLQIFDLLLHLQPSSFLALNLLEIFIDRRLNYLFDFLLLLKSKQRAVDKNQIHFNCFICLK